MSSKIPVLSISPLCQLWHVGLLPRLGFLMITDSCNCFWYPMQTGQSPEVKWNHLILAPILRIGNLSQKPFRTLPLTFHWSGWVTGPFLYQSLTRGMRLPPLASTVKIHSLEQEGPHTYVKEDRGTDLSWCPLLGTLPLKAT